MGISVNELEAIYTDLARATVLSLQGLATGTLPGNPSNHADCPESLILQREQMGYLHDAVAALPERLRFVVVAHYFEHRQMSQIAVELSVTQSRVSQMCTEAIMLVRDGMNSQLDPDALRPLAKTGRAAAARTAYLPSTRRSQHRGRTTRHVHVSRRDAKRPLPRTGRRVSSAAGSPDPPDPFSLVPQTSASAADVTNRL